MATRSAINTGRITLINWLSRNYGNVNKPRPWGLGSFTAIILWLPFDNYYMYIIQLEETESLEVNHLVTHEKNTCVCNAAVRYYPTRIRKGSCNRFCLSSSSVVSAKNATLEDLGIWVVTQKVQMLQHGHVRVGYVLSRTLVVTGCAPYYTGPKGQYIYIVWGPSCNWLIVRICPSPR